MPDSKPQFDMSQYGAPLFEGQSIKAFANNVAEIKVPLTPWFLTLPFLALKGALMLWLHTMYSQIENRRMEVDKAKFSAGLISQVHSDNNIV